MSPESPPALLIAAALVLIPVFLGWALGRHLGDSSHPVPRVARLCTPTLLLVGMNIASPRMDLWDAVGVGVCLGIGLFASTFETRRVLRIAAQIVLTCLLAEAASRVALPPGPQFAGEADVVPPWLSTAPHRLSERTCAWIFPEADQYDFEDIRTTHVKPQEPVVMHLGDSMPLFPPYGSASADPTRFPLRMGSADPDHAHVNMSFPGASYDGLLRVARTWLPRLHVREVVLYAFLENDLAELGRPYPCCQDGLVDISLPSAPELCPRPSPPLLGSPKLEHLMTRSRDPILVRVVSAWSHLARHLRARLHHIAAFRGPWSATLDANDTTLKTDDLEQRWQWTENLLQALRDEAHAHDAALTIVALPIGPHLEGVARDPGLVYLRPRVARMARIAQALDIPFVDAWPALEEIPPPRDDYFMEDGYHLSLRGHEVLANWLIAHPLVPPRAAAPRDVAPAP